jgi:hypothetical protein
MAMTCFSAGAARTASVWPANTSSTIIAVAPLEAPR